MTASTFWIAPLALLVILTVILTAARLLQGRLASGQAVAGRDLRLVETLAIDPKRRLCLVNCGPRRVLLLTGGTSDVVVGWVDAP